MSIKTVYQTLEDRGTDLERLEANGPYLCDWENSWLGDGYYFWDTFIDNAHWWGREARRYRSGYIICKAICDFNDTECLDLYGNLEQLAMFREAYELMKAQTLADQTTTVKQVFSFLKEVTNSFNFIAVRANGLKSRSPQSIFNASLFFESEKPQSLDLVPTVQICFYRKESLNLRNYKIVFPENYKQDNWV